MNTTLFLEANKLYTLQLRMTGSKIGETITEELKDLNHVQVTEIKKTLFTQGVWIQRSPVCRELINPWKINEALFIKQERPYNDIS